MRITTLKRGQRCVVTYFRYHIAGLFVSLLHAVLTPPALLGGRSSRGRRHIKDAVLSHRRAYEVEVGAQHDQYGEEGEAEAEASDTAAQGEAEPVDQPAEQKRNTQLETDEKQVKQVKTEMTISWTGEKMRDLITTVSACTPTLSFQREH